jgi:hypothetical protein
VNFALFSSLCTTGVKGKGKVAPVLNQASRHEEVLGDVGIAPRVPNLGTCAGEWSASRPGRFIPGEKALRTHFIEGWVDLRAGLDAVAKRKNLTLPLPGIDLRSSSA